MHFGLKKEIHMKIKDICLISLCLALLIVASKLVIPLGPIPMTLQTLVVIGIGLMLGTKRALILFLLYIVMGVIGIPVFSKGGGPAYVLEPSFGFIIGFACSSLITGFHKGKFHLWENYVKGLLGLFVLDVVGMVYMYFIFKYYLKIDASFLYIIEVGLTPFILKDIASTVLSAFIVNRLRPILNRYEIKDYKGA